MTATVPNPSTPQAEAVQTADAAQLTPVAPVATWPPLREMDADTAQASFHALMEALSFPGTIRALPSGSSTAPVPAAVVPLLALTDLMTPVVGLDPDGAEAVAAVARLTGAPVAGEDTARFALALGDPGDFSGLHTGSHWSPEKGATLVQRVASLEAQAGTPDAPGSVARDSASPHGGSSADAGCWRLTGPGIPPHAPRVVRVSGLSEAWLSHRQALVSDYPAGVDCLLITDEGELLALSRTTVIEVI